MISPEPDLISEVTIEEIKIEPEDEELNNDDADAQEQMASEPSVKSAGVTNCEKCNRLFNSQRGFKNHVIRCKGSDPAGKTSWLYNCKICAASFKFRSHLRRHMGLHKPFKCELCNTGLSSQSTLKNHMKITHGKAILQCKTCGSEFKKSSAFYSHRRMVHKEVFTKEKMLRERSVSDIRTKVRRKLAYSDFTALLLAVTECKTCHRFFESKEGIISHEVSCNELNEAPDLLYTCHLCTISFRTVILLSAHLKEHKDGKLLKCRVGCEKWFYVSQKRDDHEKVCGLDKYSCMLCDTKLANQKSLRKHMIFVHVEAKHECETCGKMFKRRTYMIGHQLAFHSENPPKFTCEICERVFTRAEKLRKHMEKHVKPEPCL